MKHPLRISTFLVGALLGSLLPLGVTPSAWISRSPAYLPECGDVEGCFTEQLPVAKTIKELVYEQGGESAVRIAECESQFKPWAKNKKSSASGLFQFTQNTWKVYCSGDVLNAQDNLTCFNKLYPQHKSWWQCL